jgi:ribosome recycling factor
MATKNIPSLTIQERNELARQAELEGDTAKAIKLYEQNIRQDKADEFAFDRLLILYRKTKAYKDELRVINRGIEVFSKRYSALLETAHSDHSNRSKIKRLSDSLMKKIGMKNIYQPEPLGKWLKRKQAVAKKLR